MDVASVPLFLCQLQATIAIIGAIRIANACDAVVEGDVYGKGDNGAIRHNYCD